MSRYGGVYSQPDYCSKVKRYRAPAALPAFKYRITGGRKVTDLYRGLHDAWRAGVIADFYYGTRSEIDSTLVWQIDGKELDAHLIPAAVEILRKRAGIESIEIGQPWCGYPTMTVTYADGSVLVDRYDGRARVESLTGGPEKRAGGKDLFPELDGLATF